MKDFLKSPLLVIVLAINLFSPIVISAADLTTQSQAPVIQDVDGLRAEFKEYDQNPATHVVKYEMILKSNIDSDRVRITWTTTGANIFQPQTGYTIDGTSARGDIAIKKGQTYKIPIEVTITGSGINEIFGRAEAFLAQSTYIATVRKDYATNDQAEVLPLTDSYNQAKTQNTIINIAGIIVVIVVILILLFLGVKMFIKWLDKDERDLAR